MGGAVSAQVAKRPTRRRGTRGKRSTLATVPTGRRERSRAGGRRTAALIPPPRLPPPRRGGWPLPILPTGSASVAGATSLHPWLQSVAPPGRTPPQSVDGSRRQRIRRPPISGLAFAQRLVSIMYGIRGSCGDDVRDRAAGHRGGRHTSKSDHRRPATRPARPSDPHPSAAIGAAAPGARAGRRRSTPGEGVARRTPTGDPKQTAFRYRVPERFPTALFESSP